MLKTRSKVKMGRKFREKAYEYSKNTSLHGMPYMMGTALKIWERVVWCLVFLTCIVVVIIWITVAYKEWEDQPVITTVKTTGKQSNCIVSACVVYYLNLRCTLELCAISCHHHLPIWLPCLQILSHHPHLCQERIEREESNDVS